ncbi:MAG: ATP-dependent helicase [Candidatus Electrothrix sp. AS4_5]|nr:ATP-dependent helicase [Candidatus Electrothrix gigas]
MQRMNINSNFIIKDIEQHFRVSAGPGAGKTYWLIGHIRNLLHCSGRLSKTRSIVCLTYSNVGVETIKRRLGTSAQQVEVSTIHSFLYRHIVRPYVWSISHEYDLNVKLMDGHDEVGNYKFHDWIKKDYRSLKYLSDNKKYAIKCLEKQEWVLVENELKRQIVIRDDKDKACEKFLRNNKHEKYLKYKKLYWNDGVVSHDDVLFFSYQIIKKHPFVLDVLRAKFPYFLVDEFQDTSPIQIEILNQLGQQETIVGIIGDTAQSIYGFQGASAELFAEFSLPKIQDYVIADNRRSTNQIIDLLGHIRTDIKQNKYKNVDNEKPILYQGARKKVIAKIKEEVTNEELAILSFKNEVVRTIEKDYEGTDKKLFNELKNEDSNGDRKRLIEACIKATELANKKKFKDAIQEFIRLERRNELKKRRKDKNENSIEDSLKLEWRKKALSNISFLLLNYEKISQVTITDFSNNFISPCIKKISKITPRGEKNVHKRLIKYFFNCVIINDDSGLYRTIHKSKGDEFKNVLLVLEDEKELEFIKKPDLKKEEHRVRYVAVSRAEKRLFIYVPECEDFSNDYLLMKRG